MPKCGLVNTYWYMKGNVMPWKAANEALSIRDLSHHSVNVSRANTSASFIHKAFC